MGGLRISFSKVLTIHYFGRWNLFRTYIIHPENFSTLIPQIHLEMAHVSHHFYMQPTGMLGPKKPSELQNTSRDGVPSRSTASTWLAGKSTSQEFLNESMYFDFGNGEFPISMLVFRYIKHLGGSVLIKHTPAACGSASPRTFEISQWMCHAVPQEPCHHVMAQMHS